MLYTIIIEIGDVVTIEQVEAPTPAAALERWSRRSAVRPVRPSDVEPTTVTGFSDVWCVDTFDKSDRYVLLHIVETDGRISSDRWVVVWNIHGGTLVTKAHGDTAHQALEHSAGQVVKSTEFMNEGARSLYEASMSTKELEAVFPAVWRWRHGPFDAIVVPVPLSSDCQSSETSGDPDRE